MNNTNNLFMDTLRQVDKKYGNAMPPELSSVVDNGKLNPNLIAENIQKVHRLISCAGEFYEYDHGVYVRVGKERIRQYIKEIAGKDFRGRLSEEVLLSLETDIYIEVEKLNATKQLNVKNGILDLEKMVLYPHDNTILSSIQLGVSYEPGVQCALWEKSLDEIFEGDFDKISVLQEYMGLCFTKDVTQQRALFLIGEGANGKSVILGTLEELLGKENFSAIPLEKFNDAHYVSALFGKLANISIETNAKSEVYDSVFKAVVSGDALTADPKYRHPFTFFPFCKLVFALNSMPRVDDKTDAFFRRLIILRLNKQFTDEEQNKQLPKQLKAELNGIFNWCMVGLARLNERGVFQVPDSVKAEVADYRRENNNIMVFVDEECEFHPQTEISKQTLYDNYAIWCKDNGYKAVAKKKLSVELLRHYKAISERRSNTERFWEGISSNYKAKEQPF